MGVKMTRGGVEGCVLLSSLLALSRILQQGNMVEYNKKKKKKKKKKKEGWVLQSMRNDTEVVPMIWGYNRE